ncbi:MAG: flagellin FliC [Planctomycetes bacterium]|nr:flagellin FliC [Planctomycetota bacterium]
MSRIVTNSSAVTVFKNYSRASSGLASSAEKLATGLRINRASDDPAGLAISETLRAQVKGANMAAENIANANAFINTADGYLQNASDILGRMEELAVEYGDPTKSADDLLNLSAEFAELQAQASDIFANATYNGVSIFAADLSGLVIDADGNTQSISGLDGSTASGDIAAAGIDDVASIQDAITSLSSQRGTLGASQSRLNYTLTGLENYAENVSAAESRIRNVDIAKETTNFSRFQIQLQASTAMLAQANSSTQNVLSLLG